MFTKKSLLCKGAFLAMCALASVCTQAQEMRLKETLAIAPAWTAQPVGFALLTDAKNNRQYVGYYDVNHNMVVASRTLDSTQWQHQVLPSKIGWDSHNYITMALDSGGQLHVAGNMHNSPLVYFRSTVPGDIASLEQIPSMVGKREERMTYPSFINGADGTLYFTYRDGQSGSGSNLYNRYDDRTGRWQRLIDTPLFDGQGRMSAYPEGPVMGPDGYWHLAWMWRDTPDASTCHDLSYVRSKDLVNWQNVEGKTVRLPITPDTRGVVVDPVPVNGGLINGSGKLGFDTQGRAVIAYHKFDDKGFTQIYLARAQGGGWEIEPITEWNYRWEPKGYGSIPFNVRHSGVQHDSSLGLYMFAFNAQDGGGNWHLDAETLALGERIPDHLVPGHVPGSLRAQVTPPLQLRFARDLGASGSETRYMLAWQSLPENADRPRQPEEILPAQLQLIVLEKAAAAE